MPVSTFFQLLIAGILQGGVYALAAFGLSLIFGVSNVLNLAHGQFLMLGALGVYLIFSLTPISPFLISILLIPLFFFMGCLFDMGLIRRLMGRLAHEQVEASILVTLGASLAIQDFASFLWGSEDKGIPYFLPTIQLGDIFISSVRLLGLGFIILLTLALHLYLKRTYLGKAIRAVTQNRRGASLVGINASRISTITFGIGTVLASLAGVFYVILYTVSPDIGIPLTIKYLCVIVLGGLGSLYGTLVGGTILGLAEAFTGYFSPHWGQTSAFLLLVVILLIRPKGLFG
jgi:branched-chain amino acid transport system permease protein